LNIGTILNLIEGAEFAMWEYIYLRQDNSIKPSFDRQSIHPRSSRIARMKFSTLLAVSNLLGTCVLAHPSALVTRQDDTDASPTLGEAKTQVSDLISNITETQFQTLNETASKRSSSGCTLKNLAIRKE
jgi:hypothetical protein